jgi:glycosyltransferase involved in cell wall biosynthesis
MAKVSVILPVYNCDQYIFETIQSVLNQTFTDFELLIVDDCSTDNTVAIIRAFDDDRIQLTLKEKNTGYTDSLNYAVSIAKGQYIARMDGDDICMPTRFEKQVAFLDTNPTIILCGSAIQIIGTDTILRHPSNHEEIKVKLCFGTSFYHPSVMGKIEVFRANPYDKAYEPAEDYDLWTRLVFQGELANLEEVLLLYRVHDNQVSKERKTIQEAHSLWCKLQMFSQFQINDYFSLDDINLVFGHKFPISFQDCEKVQFVTSSLIEKNKELQVFDLFEFEKVISRQKISKIKNYITKDKFLKFETYAFLVKHCSIKDSIRIIDLKKRIKTFFDEK